MGVGFALISCLFAEQYLFENFVPILEQLSNANATASFGVLASSVQSAMSTIELLTVSNLFRADSNEISFLNKRLSRLNESLI